NILRGFKECSGCLCHMNSRFSNLLTHINDIQNFAAALNDIAFALAHRWFSEIVSASPVITSLQAAWLYLLIPAQKGLFNALLSVDSFSSLTTSQRHVQLLVPFRLIH
ncbi:hypothetical protein L0N33_18740, partial [Roseburia faecis]|nr:hypothetical protein [Roseburia faecis]